MRDVGGKTWAAPSRLVERPSLDQLTVALLCGVSLTTNMLLGLILPLLPSTLESLAPAFASVGALDALLVAVFPAAMLLGSPLAAVAAARYGRFALLKACLAMQVGATILFGYSPAIGTLGARSDSRERVALATTGLLLLARLLQGAAAAGSSLSALVIATDAFPRTLASVMGLNEVAIGVGFTVAPVFSAALFALGGFEAPFLVVAGLSVAVMLLAELCDRRRCRVMQHPSAAAARGAAEPSGRSARGLGGLVCAAGAARLAFAAFGLALATCVFGSTNALLAVRLDAVGLPAAHIGVAYGALSASYSLCAMAAGALADRWSSREQEEARGAAGRPGMSAYQQAMGCGLLLSGAAAFALATCARAPLAERGGGGARGPGAPDEPAAAEWRRDLAALLLLGGGQAFALVPALPALRAAAAGTRAHVARADEAGGQSASARGVGTYEVVCLFNVAMQAGMVAGPLLGSLLAAAAGFARAQLCIGGACIAYAAATAALRLLEPRSEAAGASAALLGKPVGDGRWRADSPPPTARDWHAGSPRSGVLLISPKLYCAGAAARDPAASDEGHRARVL